MKKMLGGAALLFLIVLGLLAKGSDAGAAPPLGQVPAPFAGELAAPTPAPPVPSPPTLKGPEVGRSVRNDVSPPLRSIRPIPPRAPLAPGQPTEIPNFPRPAPVNPVLGPSAPAAPQTDPLLPIAPSSAIMPTPLQNFDGMTNTDNVYPPDTVGDVGPNHYIQMVNLSMQIWDKSGNSLWGPFPTNTLWTGFGGVGTDSYCETYNHGDPIVLYDPIADRWLISQFAVPTGGPYYECIAISQTADPTGAWYRYAFLVHATKMNDYPKFGVWPDGYYMSANQFTYSGGWSWAGAGVYVFDRAAMLSGAAATFQYFDLAPINMNYWGLLPADLDGAMQPPAGAPNYFAAMNYPPYAANYQIEFWKFDVDWTTPGNSTFTGPTAITTASFVPDLCGSARNCIPQPGTTQGVDAISDRLMARLQYRNIGDHESLVVNHTVDAGGGRAGIRWYELRDPNGEPYIYQQGTYAPSDTENRWMGSVAMDGEGNLALGYSVSSGSVYPSIRYAGRLADDPLGQLPQGETTMVTGSGSQTGTGARWGDYSAMSVDPNDDCTFWYTQQYYATTSAVGWKTRVGSFKFPTCGLVTGILSGTVTNSGSGQPISGAQIQATNGPTTTFSTATAAEGTYSLVVYSSTYTVTASAYGFLPSTVTGVTVVSGTTTTQNFALAPALSYVVSGTVSDGSTGWPLYSRLDIAGYPGGGVWTDPVTGFYSATLPGSASYAINVTSWITGYTPLTSTVSVTTTDQAKGFALSPDLTACTAPGYKPAVYAQDFEGNNGGYFTGGPGLTSFAWGEPSSGPAMAHSGRKVWATNLFGNYGVDENGYVSSPDIDLSAYPGQTLSLRWWQWLQTEASYDFASAEVSKDGGLNWTTVYSASGSIDLSWALKSVDLDQSYNVSNFRVRIRLDSDYSINYPGYYIDDVAIVLATCQVPTGGLVAGNVYDANTSTALAGASIAGDGGTSTSTSATADPAVPDSFYVLFSPTGLRTVTATMAGGYGPLAAAVVVTAGGTLRHDFSLPAGQLSVNPLGLSVTLTRGLSSTVPFTLSNGGGYLANYTIVEGERSAAPLNPNKPLPYKRQAIAYWDPSESAPVGTIKTISPAGWSAGTSIPTGSRYRAAGASVDGQTYYVFGGANAANNVLSESWKYDPAQNQWTRLADMPVALMNMEAVAIDRYIYLVGGYTGSAHTNNFLTYDTLQNSWTASTWPKARTPMTAAWNGRLYAFGGNPGPSTETWMYSPATGVWSGPLAPLATATTYGAAIAVGNRIYVIGGGGVSAVQRYEPATDTWDSNGPALPDGGRMNPVVAWYGDAIYVVTGGGLGGGANLWTPYTTTLTLNPSLWPTTTWTTSNESVTTPVVAAAYECAASRIYAAGGAAGSASATTKYDLNQYLDGGLPCHHDNGLPWLSESPVSGTVPAVNSQAINVTFDTTAGITQAGTYYGRLWFRQNTPYLLDSLPVTLTVLAQPPVANFNASPISGTRPMVVSFSDLSSGDITSRFWNFGDGSTITTTQTSLTHTFTSTGAFTVSLSLSGPTGTSLFTRSNYITVTEAPLVAGFSATPVSGTVPLTVTFTNQSTGDVVSAFWDFGDGSTISSTQASLNHVYSTPGTYSVGLTVSGPGGSSAVTKTGLIHVFSRVYRAYLPLILRNSTGSWQ